MTSKLNFHKVECTPHQERIHTSVIIIFSSYITFKLKSGILISQSAEKGNEPRLFSSTKIECP